MKKKKPRQKPMRIWLGVGHLLSDFDSDNWGNVYYAGAPDAGLIEFKQVMKKRVIRRDTKK